jgi:predicted dehydrogenase
VIADMANAVLQGRDPNTNGFEARKSLALVLAMYESARIERPVEMDEEIWNGRGL